jgi:hypothetical protein
MPDQTSEARQAGGIFFINGHIVGLELFDLLGHELQHAIEVLSEPTITDGVTMFSSARRPRTTVDSRRPLR